jgi:hypothetical protein
MKTEVFFIYTHTKIRREGGREGGGFYAIFTKLRGRHYIKSETTAFA